MNAKGICILVLLLLSGTISAFYPARDIGDEVSVKYSCSGERCMNNTLAVDLKSDASIRSALSVLRPFLGSLAEYIPNQDLSSKVTYALEHSYTLNLPSTSNVLLNSISVTGTNKKLKPDLPDERLGYVLEFASEPLVTHQSKHALEKTAEASAAYSASLAQEHAQVLSAIKAVAPNAKVTHQYTKVFNGVSVTAKESDLSILTSLAGVKRIYPIQKVHALLNDSVPLINADDAWTLHDSHGLNVTGVNKTIAIIDTGIDYTHPDLGACSSNNIVHGTLENYSLESEHPYNDSADISWTITRPGYTNISLHFSKIDVESGWDYVSILNGSNQTVIYYTGSQSDLWTPTIPGNTITVRLTSDDSITSWGFAIDRILNGTIEFVWNCTKIIGGYDFVNYDSDPMDDNGHGTHCAAIAASNGTLRGVAPSAKLYAYKVLDSSGSGYTSDIIAALDAAVDPNGDNDTSDHVDVISMSLGASGTPDDALSLATDNTVDAGVVVVAAAGNDGPDNYSIGCPGCARKALTVGATYKNNVSSGRTQTKLFVVTDNNTELWSLGFTYSNTTPAGGLVKQVLYADIGYAGNFTSQNFTDKIALMRRGELNFSQKVANAVAAGAVGAIIYNNEQGNFYGTLDSPSPIPAVSTSKENGTYLLNLIIANTTRVNLTVIPEPDIVAEFSSRGPAFIYDKPDVIAPGVLICAAQYADFENDSKCFDNRHIAISGTSMATPHVAGAAALILQAHPDWSPLEVKSALKYTARDFGLPRNKQGAGLIDVYAAANLTKPPPVALIIDVRGVVYEY